MEKYHSTKESKAEGGKGRGKREGRKGEGRGREKGGGRRP
jgi:hypothetical protein